MSIINLKQQKSRRQYSVLLKQHFARMSILVSYSTVYDKARGVKWLHFAIQV